MLYAVIIVICLAAAFIILARRLPKAIEMTEPTRVREVRPTRPFKWPAFKLPTVKLAAVKLPQVRLPAVKLPVFKLPRFRRQVEPESTKQPVVPMTTEELTAARPGKNGDFWAEAPVTETVNQPVAPPATASVVPAVEPSVPDLTPEVPSNNAPKGRGRNLSQEAEDAFAIKDYKKAEKLYLRLATEEPKNAKVYSRLGLIYLEQKIYEDARDALQVALKLEPNSATRHFNLALAYLNLNSKAKAVSAMELALKYDPSNRKYRKMLDDIIAGRA